MQLQKQSIAAVTFRYIVPIFLLVLLSGCVDFAMGVFNHVEKKTGGFDKAVETTGDNIIKAEEIARWTYAANGGDAEAQYRMGKAFCCGPRPYYNTYDALRWFCKSAKQGQRDALFEVGKIYSHVYDTKEQPDEGSLIPNDNLVSYVYFSKSAEHGNDVAVKYQNSKYAILTDLQKKKAQEMLDKWPDIQCEIH